MSVKTVCIASFDWRLVYVMTEWVDRKLYNFPNGHSIDWIRVIPKTFNFENIIIGGHLVADVLMGTCQYLPADKQERVLGLFRSGHLNTLFSTSVAEEGLDVQHCSTVVCYDVPCRPLSMVQTVGRARSRNARVLFMHEITDNPQVLRNQSLFFQKTKEFTFFGVHWSDKWYVW